MVLPGLAGKNSHLLASQVANCMLYVWKQTSRLKCSVVVGGGKVLVEPRGKEVERPVSRMDG